MGAPVLRYRGLRLPQTDAVVSADTARALKDGAWQPALTEAAFALARPSDRALIVGTGVGHLVAILAAKLGLPHVHIVEPDATRRAHLDALARENGLCRLSFAASDGLAALAPTLLFADTASARLPRLAPLSALRAVAVDVGRAPAPGLLPALLADAEAAGLVYDTGLSAGSGLVLTRRQS